MSELVVEILEDFLGEPKKHDESKCQLRFDCPECSMEKGMVSGDGKGNLEVNYLFNAYNCWACGDINHTHGTIRRLIKRYGNKQQLRRYNLINPYENLVREDEQHSIEGLPKGYKSLKEDDGSYDHQKAIEYLKKRNIGIDLIKKFNLGYATDGDYAGRIIVPSYDRFGNINYYLGRSYGWTKMKYKNPEVSKMDIIFNEGKINWDSNVYIVEGVFDHIPIPNSIPLLGKVLNDHIMEALLNKLTAKVIIVLDSDAYKDALKLYKRLNNTKLHNRVMLVKMPEGYDIADIHQKLGSKGVVKVLSKAKKIKESRL
jgi:DNA primase